MFQVVKKLKLLKPKSKELNIVHFSNIEQNADIANKLLLDLQMKCDKDHFNQSLAARKMEAAEAYKPLYTTKFSFLKHREKEAWNMEAYTNTKFFYNALRNRKIHNRVIEIENVHGNVRKAQGNIQVAFLKYYQSLLGSAFPVTRVNNAFL
ncbi:hypothetical protein vseg_017679 [Gypsophila vaccaria]